MCTPAVRGAQKASRVTLFFQDLLEQNQVLEVGGNTVRLVTLASAKPWLLHSVRPKGQEGDSDVPREDAQPRPLEGTSSKDSAPTKEVPPSQGPQGPKRRASWSTDSADQPPVKKPALQDTSLTPDLRPETEEKTKPQASAPEDKGTGDQQWVRAPCSLGQEQQWLCF